MSSNVDVPHLSGLAKTGSGKTLAYVWPIIVHVLDQPQMSSGDGPISLILSPTRELTEQIYTETKRFAKLFNIRTCAVFGGGGKYEMQKALKDDVPEIVGESAHSIKNVINCLLYYDVYTPCNFLLKTISVATPGRLIDLIIAKTTNLRRCTLVVLDEADRMFEMGFEYQIRSILQNIRPTRQTLMFSATMKRKIEAFAREVLSDPIRIVVGAIGQANIDVHQSIIILPDEKMKWGWLTSKITGLLEEGKIIIFVNAKANTEELATNLRANLKIGVEYLHGDKEQSERSSVIRKFKTGEIQVLVATDVAARGLDIKQVQNVINFEAARNIETHVHRIGRTGRMG